MQLGPFAQASGYTLDYCAELDSTNSQAMRIAQASTGEGSRPHGPTRRWIVAVRQSAGRGRLARPWVSQEGNLFASLLLTGEVSPAHSAQLGFVTGVALREAVSAIVPSTIKPQLKWPNDLVCNGAKVAGILLEGSILPDGRFACVIGCGVNCRAHPDDTPYAVANLAALGASVSSAELFTALSDSFARWFERWGNGQGFGAVRAAWLERAAGLGGPIRIASRDGMQGCVTEGIFETIDEAGQLILLGRNGRQIINTGDVMFASPGEGANAPGAVG